MSEKIPAHNTFVFDEITFNSNFDNGNLARVERNPNRPYEFKIWTAPDNLGTEFQSRHCAWFYFSVTGLPLGCVLRIQVVNASNHSGLYKHDMRPVFRSNATNQKWVRLKSSVRFQKTDEVPQLTFEHGIECANDKLFFAFTYPFTYQMLQDDLEELLNSYNNHVDTTGTIFCQRELLTYSRDKRRLDLLTITSLDGASTTEHFPLLSGLFPDTKRLQERPPLFPKKDIIFVSARVHPGEVPAQHTFRGALTLLLDPDDTRAKELRARYVFILIPMLNPDGVYRGHFRMDQLGQNLNRYYTNPDCSEQPTIYAAKTLLDYCASTEKLVMYLDMHAHASKRGCFIYGNVLETIEDQIQNQMFCKLIALNTPHFDYEGCLFSKEHMTRIDPGDQAKGLTAEGSGRVATYLAHKLIHSYTLECNYNTSRVGNEVPPTASDIGGSVATPPSAFTTNPEKYTPNTYAGVGQACLVAMLDLRGQNPCSRIPRSKLKTYERFRNMVMMEVRSRKDFISKQMERVRRKSGTDKKGIPDADEIPWRRLASDSSSATSEEQTQESNGSARGKGSGNPGIIFISTASSNARKRRQSISGSGKVSMSNPPSASATPTSRHKSVNENNKELVSASTEPDNENVEAVYTNKVAQYFANYRKISEGSPNNSPGKISTSTSEKIPRSRENIDNSFSAMRISTDTAALLRKVESRTNSDSDANSDNGGDMHLPSKGKHKMSDTRSVGSSPIRALIREQQAAKVAQFTNSNSSQSANSSLSSSESVRCSSRDFIPTAVRKSSQPVVYKDNRKILGKTLHAAGVALLMNNSNNNSTDNLQQHQAPQQQPKGSVSRNSSSKSISSSDNFYSKTTEDVGLPMYEEPVGIAGIAFTGSTANVGPSPSGKNLPFHKMVEISIQGQSAKTISRSNSKSKTGDLGEM